MHCRSTGLSPQATGTEGIGQAEHRDGLRAAQFLCQSILLPISTNTSAPAPDSAASDFSLLVELCYRGRRRFQRILIEQVPGSSRVIMVTAGVGLIPSGTAPEGGWQLARNMADLGGRRHRPAGRCPPTGWPEQHCLRAGSSSGLGSDPEGLAEHSFWNPWEGFLLLQGFGKGGVRPHSKVWAEYWAVVLAVNASQGPVRQW